MSIDNVSRGGRWLFAAGAATLLAAAGAGAQTPASAPSANGVMTFPNVRVETASPEMMRAFQSKAPTSGMRAFIDPATGQLAEPIASEVQGLEALEHRMPAEKLMIRRSPVIHGPNGIFGLRLDESTMNYSLARRAADGAVIAACVPGEQAATWLENPRSFGLPIVAGAQVKEELQ